MMKRMLALLLAAVLLVLTGCGEKETEPVPTAAPTATPVPTATPTPAPTLPPEQAAYEAATRLMLNGEYAAAAEAFAAWPGYSDAPQMAIYCRGLACAESGDYASAVLAFAALDSFKDSAIKAAYYTAVGAQAAAEKAWENRTLPGLTAALEELERAENAFNGLTYLVDVPERLERVRSLRTEMSAVAEEMYQARLYDEVRSAGDGCFFVRRGSLWGMIDARGNEVHPFVWPKSEYNKMELRHGVLFQYSQYASRDWSVKDAYVYIYTTGCSIHDMTGRELLSGVFSWVEIDEYGIWVEDQEGVRRGYTLAGEELTSLNGARQIAPERLLQTSEGRWALTDLSGSVLYEAAETLDTWALNGQTMWAGVTNGAGSQTVLVTLDGQELLRGGANALASEAHMEYAALTAEDGTVSVYGPDGSKLFDSPWQQIAWAGEGLFAVRDEAGLGYVDLQGGVVIPCGINERSNPTPAFRDGYVLTDWYVYARDGGSFAPPEDPWHWRREGDFVLMDGGVTSYDIYMTVFTLAGEMVMEVENCSYISGSGSCFAYINDGVITICDAEGNAVY